MITSLYSKVTVFLIEEKGLTHDLLADFLTTPY